MRIAIVALGLLAVAGGTGCTDPGCIRNTECGMGFRCIEAECVRVAVDASAGDDDAGS